MAVGVRGWSGRWELVSMTRLAVFDGGHAARSKQVSLVYRSIDQQMVAYRGLLHNGAFDVG
jgi:hypothetical protein